MKKGVIEALHRLIGGGRISGPIGGGKGYISRCGRISGVFEEDE